MVKLFSKLSRGHKFSSSGGSLVTLCFFLPWILTSCGSNTVRLSGYAMAVGRTISLLEFEPQPTIFIVLLTGIFALVVASHSLERNIQPTLDGIALMLAAALSAFVLFDEIAYIDKAVPQVVYVEIMPGFWGTGLGICLIAYGGFLNWQMANLDTNKKGKAKKT